MNMLRKKWFIMNCCWSINCKYSKCICAVCFPCCLFPESWIFSFNCQQEACRARCRWAIGFWTCTIGKIYCRISWIKPPICRLPSCLWWKVSATFACCDRSYWSWSASCLSLSRYFDERHIMITFSCFAEASRKIDERFPEIKISIKLYECTYRILLHTYLPSIPLGIFRIHLFFQC